MILVLKYFFKKEGNLSKEDRQQLEELLVPLLSFSYHFTQGYKQEGKLYYSSKPNWRLLVKNRHELIGSLSIVERRLEKPFDLSVGGIGNLGVKNTYQKQGLATLMLEKSHLFMRARKLDLSLLFCVEKLKNFYLKVGYRQIKKPVVFTNENDQTEKEELAFFFPILLDERTSSSLRFSKLNLGKGTW